MLKKLTFSIFITIICCLVFFPIFSNDFQYNWDDQWQLFGHPMIRDQTMANIWYYFTNYVDGLYFPLNQLYYILLYNISGYSPFTFHLGSLVLHIVNSFMVYILVSQAFSILGIKSISDVKIIAFLSALFFSIHPLQVETIAWVSASKVLLYSFFTLLGLLFYLRYLGSKKIGRWINLFLCFSMFCFSLVCKEQAVAFPGNIALLTFLWIRVNRLSMSWEVLIVLLTFFAVSILFGIWTYNSQSFLSDEYNVYPLFHRLVFFAYSLVVYLLRFLALVNLLYFYGYPMEVGESLPYYLYIYILPAIFLIWLVFDFYNSGNWLMLFGITFYFINLVLTLHILPLPRQTITADRFVYLSLVGPAIALSVVLLYLIRKMNWNKVFAFSIISFIVIGLGILSNLQIRKWENSSELQSDYFYYKNFKINRNE